MLVTTTFSPSLSDMRGQLALKTCRAARDCGYTIIVVDGSPSQEFKAALRETGAAVIDQKMPGMGQSRRECINAGVDSAADVIVWLEPEKHPIVSLLDACIEPVISGKADVVIPSRNTFTNYPKYQAESESRGNAAMGELIGRSDLDFYIGPRVLSYDAAREMAFYDGKIGDEQVYGDKWEILFIPLLWFVDWGWKIASVPVDYIHPIEQFVEDDDMMRKKRDEQREILVSAMTAEAKRLKLVAV